MVMTTQKTKLTAMTNMGVEHTITDKEFLTKNMTMGSAYLLSVKATGFQRGIRYGARM